MEMAAAALRRDATEQMKEEMQLKLDDERQQVRVKMREQVHQLLRLGAEITKMTYRCTSEYSSRACVSPKNMRDSYVQDGSLLNIKCIHWIFSELPFATHQDVLPQRKSHMDLAVEKVERDMNITWAAATGTAGSHRNCLQQVYSKMLNDKKQTIIKEEGNPHKRKPTVRRPKSMTAAGINGGQYKKGKNMYFWSSKEEGEHLVSTEACVLCDV